MQKRQAIFAFIISFLSCFSLPVYAALTGDYGYIGLMLGPGHVDKNRAVFANGTFAQTFMKPSNNPFAARFYFGYNFTAYAGFELGFGIFSKVNYEGENGEKLFCCDETGCTQKRPYAYVGGFDLMGKLVAPMGPFSVFAKGGVVASVQKSTADFNPGTLCQSRTSKQNSYRPQFSFGVGYELNQNWVVDVSYTQVQVKGIINRINYWALGISYHFVNVYCGQFLCDD